MPPKKTNEQKVGDKKAKYDAQMACFAQFDAAQRQKTDAREAEIEKTLSYAKSSRNIELDRVAKMFPLELQTETTLSFIPRSRQMHRGCNEHSGKAMINFYTSLKAALAIDIALIDKMLEETQAIQISIPVTDSLDPDFSISE